MYCDCPILGRCCFCMPLRRGVLTFGYINLFFSAFMIGAYSYSVHYAYNIVTIYRGASVFMPAEACITLYCLELIFTALLIYGTHMKNILYTRIYYYFAILTIGASILIQIIEFAIAQSEPRWVSMHFEAAPIMLASICIEIYLILLVRSLLKKFDLSSAPNVYDNPLQQIVYEGRTENNDVHEPTAIPVKD